jgi:hypothetical protein
MLMGRGYSLKSSPRCHRRLSVIELNEKEDSLGVIMYRQWKINGRYNYAGMNIQGLYKLSEDFVTSQLG